MVAVPSSDGRTYSTLVGTFGGVGQVISKSK